MPVRTHEPRQASRGGLNGSDGSGRTLLAVRDKARRRSVKVREDRRGCLRNSGYCHISADQAGHRAESRTEVALIGAACMVMSGAT